MEPQREDVSRPSDHPQVPPHSGTPSLQSHSAPPPPTAAEKPPRSSGRWAPWWVYLVVLLPANQLRAWVMPVGLVPEPVVVVVALAQAAVLFVTVTALWRATRPPGH